MAVLAGGTVDLDVLDRWLDEQGLPPGPLTEAAELGGGTQNVMLRFRRGADRYVLRRPPVHPRPGSDAAMRRELEVVTALARTEVPVPRVVAVHPGPGPLGETVLYVMAEVDGTNCAVELPDWAADPAARHAAGLDAARAAARLAEVDPATVGLADLGRPDGFLERQVGRWRRELASYSAVPGYPGPRLPGVDRVADWLDRHRPAASPRGLLHGDFHLANLMFARDRPAVAAVVDWEMATVGAPLLDLGWLLATWPVPGERGIMSDTPLAAAGGLATREELVAAYAEVSTHDLTDVPWYRVLACFKLGIILEGTYARACAGRAPVATGDRLHGYAESLFAQAGGLL